MSSNYLDLVHIKHDFVDGIGPWVWSKTDIHAWIGPKNDWELSHRDKLLSYVTPDKRRTVVQAGGCMGMYPRLLSDIFDNVYTFEPDPVNFHCLVANCQKDNIIKINAALGYRRELVKSSKHMFDDWETNYGVRIVEPNVSGANLPTFRIDDLGLNHCDLIMLDTEGYELNILWGAHQTLNKFRPVIFVERPTKQLVSYLSVFDYDAVDKSFQDTIFVAQR